MAENRIGGKGSNAFGNLSSDLPSGIVVFLVALPLCLGIALASGAPLFSGIIAGIVGGMVVGLASGSALSVSGPAAGLTTIVLAAITSLGSFEAFLLCVFLAGAIQVLLGWMRAGSIGNYFPTCVIKGMLAAIGLILILKQIPHAIGYDRDFIGDESFLQPDGKNTFTSLISAAEYLNPGAVIIFSISLIIIGVFDSPSIKSGKVSKVIPAPLVVVVAGLIINALFLRLSPGVAIEGEHLVSLPVADSVSAFVGQFSFPDFTAILNREIWLTAVTIAFVASLESLLSIEAVDKLDPLKRLTPLNRELRAQGLGNMVSGLIGGLPVTAVIVRSSANIAAGAQTKNSTLFHGGLLVLTVLFIPGLLNKIPLASLAAILLTVGFKLARPEIFVSMFRKGKDQFIPFCITVVAILFTDLLIGIVIGMAVGLFFVLKTNFHRAIFSVSDNGNYLVRLTKDVSFLNKALLRRTFLNIPSGSYVIIDGARSAFIDQDILETINDFRESASGRDITVELKPSVKSNNHVFKA